jgi:hypothetical protein
LLIFIQTGETEVVLSKVKDAKFVLMVALPETSSLEDGVAVPIPTFAKLDIVIATPTTLESSIEELPIVPDAVNLDTLLVVPEPPIVPAEALMAAAVSAKTVLVT